MIPTHERRLLHREPAEQRERSDPNQMRLGMEVQWKGETWYVQDLCEDGQLLLRDTETILRRTDFHTCPVQDLV